IPQLHPPSLHDALPIYESKYTTVKTALTGTPTLVLAGADALEEVVQYKEVDLVLSAMVGAAGLRPTIAAIQAGNDIALANKATPVVAGQPVMALASKHGGSLLP